MDVLPELGLAVVVKYHHKNKPLERPIWAFQWLIL